MPSLSVIILSYNTRDLTHECILRLIESFRPFNTIQFEIIVVDNSSDDGSQKLLQEFDLNNLSSNTTFKFLLNDENVGYPKGNNIGAKESRHDFLLFLNSDVLVDALNWEEILIFLQDRKDAAALTVRVDLPQGGIDPASHRGFPTPWNSLSYYLGLEKTTNSIPYLRSLFGGYHLTDQNLSIPHEIDAATGAFFLMKRSVFLDLGGFDEQFFMYGEDLDLAYRIKKLEMKIWYYPLYTVTHLKYQSGLQTQTEDRRRKTKRYFYDAMRIFYRKHYEHAYPQIVNKLMYLAIDVKERFA